MRKPISEKRLAEIRGELRNGFWRFTKPSTWLRGIANELLSEVDRQRLDSAAMLAVVQGVAHTPPNMYGACVFCGYVDHKPNCMAEQARAYLAKFPTNNEKAE